MVRKIAILPVLLSVALHAAGGALLVRGHQAVPKEEVAVKEGLAGETFDVPETDPSVDELDAVPAGASGSPSAAKARAAVASKSAGPGAHSVHARGGANATAATSGQSGADGSATAPAMFGAVGERGVSELATAFTRALPQATSGDGAWARAALGGAGQAEVRLEIDATGRLVSHQVTAPPLLRSAVERTITLIRARTFVATGAVTHLHLSATISPDAVHDGLHGDVFAIGGSFAGHEGSAFFALSIGRRIDISITRR
jgi:hypothetical protein